MYAAYPPTLLSTRAHADLGDFLHDSPSGSAGNHVRADGQVLDV